MSATVVRKISNSDRTIRELHAEIDKAAEQAKQRVSMYVTGVGRPVSIRLMVTFGKEPDFTVRG